MGDFLPYSDYFYMEWQGKYEKIGVLMCCSGILISIWVWSYDVLSSSTMSVIELRLFFNILGGSTKTQKCIYTHLYFLLFPVVKHLIDIKTWNPLTFRQPNSFQLSYLSPSIFENYGYFPLI